MTKVVINFLSVGMVSTLAVLFVLFGLAGLNLLMSFVIVTWNLYFYVKMKGIEEERWTKLLYAVVGFGWFARYCMFFLDVYPVGYSDVYNQHLFILTTLTLLALTVGSIIRVQRLGGFPLIISDAKKVVERLKCSLKTS